MILADFLTMLATTSNQPEKRALKPMILITEKSRNIFFGQTAKNSLSGITLEIDYRFNGDDDWRF